MKERIARYQPWVDQDSLDRLEAAIKGREAALQAIGAKDVGDFFTRDKSEYRIKASRFSKEGKIPSDQTPRAEATLQQKARHIEMSAEWVDTLTPEEVKAVNWFTQEGCTDLQKLQDNTIEAHPGETLEETKTRVSTMSAQLDSAIAKVIPRPKLVYRGAKLNSLPGITREMTKEEQYAKQGEALKAMQAQGAIEFTRPVSATFNPQRANTFAVGDSQQGGFIYEISTQKGAPAALASNMSVEEEVLIPRKQKYRIIGVKEVPLQFRGDDKPEMRTVVQLEEL